MFTFILLNISFGFVSLESLPECLRVVGGDITNIFKYPSVTVILRSNNVYFVQICGGTIINERHVLTVAHCFVINKGETSINPREYRIRVGSSAAHINGFIHDIKKIIFHPNWNVDTYDSDIGIMRTKSKIVYSSAVKPAILADTNYQLNDNEPVWAIGWGQTAHSGEPSEILRHVQTWTIEQSTCRKLYKNHFNVTDNMLCTGCLRSGGRDHCTRDSGSPVYHHSTVVGISSMGLGCGLPQYPGINVKISRFTAWIQANAESKESASLSEKNEETTTTQSRGINLDIRISMDLGAERQLHPYVHLNLSLSGDRW